jgi:hypothetical protein
MSFQRLVQLLDPAPFPRDIGILSVGDGPVEETPEMVVTLKVVARVAHGRIVGEQNESLKPLTAVNFR